jgi:hypothetical protein
MEATMQRKLFASLCATAAVAAGITATSAMSSDRNDRGSDERGLSAVAVTADQKLLAFRTDRPEWARSVGRLRGLTGGDARIVGVDYRPATGDLYGVGDAGGIYVIDDRSARATLRSRLNVPLAGTTFGVDFNPTVDRLRIVSDTGQNLRDNVDADNDTLTDATLTFPGPPAATALGVAGVAYTNNDADPNTGTTLFDLDTALDQVEIQSPANAGLLVPTGKLGVDAGADVGFDIYSHVRRGTTASVRGFASIGSRLHGIDLLTGRASTLGDFPRRHAVTGIAIPTGQR